MWRREDFSRLGAYHFVWHEIACGQWTKETMADEPYEQQLPRLPAPENEKIGAVEKMFARQVQVEVKAVASRPPPLLLGNSVSTAGNHGALHRPHFPRSWDPVPPPCFHGRRIQSPLLVCTVSWENGQLATVVYCWAVEMAKYIVESWNEKKKLVKL